MILSNTTYYTLLFTLLDLCVSSLRRGHANLLCVVPILRDDPRRRCQGLYYIIIYYVVSYYIIYYYCNNNIIICVSLSLSISLSLSLCVCIYIYIYIHACMREYTYYHHYYDDIL